MKYICLYTDDVDLADSFKIFFEGKYLIHYIPNREELRSHLESADCNCQALIFDAVNPTEKDVRYLHEIKESEPDLVIIMSYVYFEEKKLTEKLLASNVDDIIYKPYDFGEVDRRLQNLMSPSNPSNSKSQNSPDTETGQNDQSRVSGI